ncbi:glycosyltransferase [Flavobacteriaceae bacterium AU392]|nr:glycosyltransferase [Flavobacteriaceae bacterium]RKM82835.1 glycosyltransferase [Flavobacteriaceae bacterium AU392]
MRVLQLIDSLQAGGTERMAVNIANELSMFSDVEASYLCVTREEGLLKRDINKSVNYLFLNKKTTIDIKAILQFNKFIKKESIEIIHAHSTSFFLATIIKIMNKNVKLIWHDHYGNSEFLEQRKTYVLKFCSKYFSHIFSVNSKLEVWARKRLKAPKVSYLSNFVVKGNDKKETTLLGASEKRIIHLANLRPQKDHSTLIKAFNKVIKKRPDWTLHCVGKDFNDIYSKKIKTIIKELHLEKHVYLYGSKFDIPHILSQGQIGVLSSNSEGLPLTLLEYGLGELPVISTKVGECDKVISNSLEGILIDSENTNDLSIAILRLIDNFSEREKLGKNLYHKIINEFSSESIINLLIANYKQ